jgi:hypothetical protein
MSISYNRKIRFFPQKTHILTSQPCPFRSETALIRFELRAGVVPGLASGALS